MLVEMSDNIQTSEDIKQLVEISNDDFLAVFSKCQKLLEKNVQKKQPPIYHKVQLKKDDMLSDAKTLCDLLESTIQESTSSEELQSKLLSHGIQKDRVALLVSELDQLKELIASKKFYGKERDELIDLQWKFGVVAGSSVKEETGRTFVQVKLTSRSSEGFTSSRHIEMSLEKFYDFLHQLEKAKASLDYISYL